MYNLESSDELVYPDRGPSKSMTCIWLMIIMLFLFLELTIVMFVL